MLAAGCFVTYGLVAVPGPTGFSGSGGLASVIHVVEPRPPPPAPLSGWKEIAKFCAENGGPGSIRQLRELATKDKSCPIYGPADGFGNVVAVREKLAIWLQCRLIPLSMRSVADRAEERRVAPKAKKKATKVAGKRAGRRGD